MQHEQLGVPAVVITECCIALLLRNTVLGLIALSLLQCAHHKPVRPAALRHCDPLHTTDPAAGKPVQRCHMIVILLNWGGGSFVWTPSRAMWVLSFLKTATVVVAVTSAYYSHLDCPQQGALSDAQVLASNCCNGIVGR
jgi:hypothetical protein